ncbi:amidophosphoribosyltransferase [Listeria monocytogenes]|uniref:amidophosphoribosyltransferase n=1 Tax=Listeria monocytogenes TaxID=1639 RepID=UPI000E748E16|nr:amidophosphoribosyltransferase [Listeria monocytogenes]EAF1768873.1 amidophosphoribosyltransferase [Listeria monocytogenes]EAF1779798.1 amidophosphoribosyltransferase [Listeria monocytogenes]EAF1800092.1 amidophosphoribosyltransferase [Listeria monocytogenes]EAF1808776.1 amidophosphoribosyltransferase [Listeria monocytogenes]EAF1818578.1 amidophosphoribosyltransferase [Listeria monocytogenes]
MLAEVKGLNEECGIFGIWDHPNAAEITYYGLHSLQHRGQEGAGIVSTDGEILKGHRNLGLLADVFKHGELDDLKGKAAIGHVRYATAGQKNLGNVQPFLFHFHSSSLALAHNGNLVNAKSLRRELEEEGAIFQTSSDTEVLVHLIKRSHTGDFVEDLKVALNKVKGGFAYMLLTEDTMYAALDPNGFRPLSIGRIGDSYVVASETCAFETVGAEFVRDVEPGELIIINDDGLRIEKFTENVKHSICSMEYIYFARPDSNIAGINVHSARKRSGKRLAKEAFIDADVVTGVPDSSISAAIGYAEEAGLPYELGLIKNRYVARTFIQPSQELREQGVRMKLSAVRGVVEGKRVVMIDDSIVRGTTSKRIVQLLREAGAAEVHVRIASPPLAYPCFYGIDIQTRNELIASNYSVDEICRIIGADSLEYLSEEGLVDSIGRPYPNEPYGGLCMAYFNGDYPTPLYDYEAEYLASLEAEK